MRHIRPYKVFTLVDAAPPDRVVSIPIPGRRGVGGVWLLETFLIVAAAKIVSARRVFEFGTFLGTTTFNLALNTPSDTQIFTLDLAGEEAAAARQHPSDAPLTQMHLSAEGTFDFSQSTVRSKIITLTGDSTKFDFSRWKRSIDMVFIDGGHDLSTLRQDTESGLQMARGDKPSCVLWHDYRNPEYPDLTGFLDERSRQLEMFHIEDTMICAWFGDPSGAIQEKLLSNG